MDIGNSHKNTLTFPSHSLQHCNYREQEEDEIYKREVSREEEQELVLAPGNNDNFVLLVINPGFCDDATPSSFSCGMQWQS